MDNTPIYEQAARHFLAPILPLLDDPGISEVLVNGPAVIFFERDGVLERWGRPFGSLSALRAAIRNIAEYAGRHVDAAQPTMDARTPQGWRVNVVLPPASRCGPCLSIRKFQPAFVTLEGLAAKGSVSAAAVEFLELAVLLRKNVVIAGGTGAGKTSLLNALGRKIPHDERLVVIEDSSEIDLGHPHTISLEAQPAGSDGTGAVTIRDLFANALRMRPDRILVGEVRRGEALDMVQAMLSGHTGSLTTVHASTPRAAALRLELLCMMSDVTLPVHVARTQVAAAIDLIVQLVRLPGGPRYVASISELVGLDDRGDYQLRDLFRVVHPTGAATNGHGRALVATGERPSFASEPAALGLADRVRRTRDLFEKP